MVGAEEVKWMSVKGVLGFWCFFISLRWMMDAAIAFFFFGFIVFFFSPCTIEVFGKSSCRIFFWIQYPLFPDAVLLQTTPFVLSRESSPLLHAWTWFAPRETSELD